jgi:hypothetical protein
MPSPSIERASPVWLHRERPHLNVRVTGWGRQRSHSFRRRPAALQRIADLLAPEAASEYEAASHSSVSGAGSLPRAAG